MRANAALSLAPALALSALPAAGQDFASSPAWAMDCRLTPEARADGWCATAEECPETAYQVIWHRDRGEARLIWADGQGKGLTEIAGLPGSSGQHLAHFALSPATATYLGTGEPWADVDTGLFSVRFSGEAALTYHSVVRGGMVPLSATGRCLIAPLDSGDE